MEWIRDAPIGQIIRYVTKNKVLQYPEERDDFVCPGSYAKGAETPDSVEETPLEKQEIPASEPVEQVETTEPTEPVESEPSEPAEPSELKAELDKFPTVEAEGPHLEGIRTRATDRLQIEKVGTRAALQRSLTQKDLENQFTQALAEKGPSRPILPDKLEDGTILVDWYTTDDLANPQNWPLKKKLLVTLQIWYVQLSLIYI
jgi:MFS transporter, DHA1 family, multidrug resistance protein